MSDVMSNVANLVYWTSGTVTWMTDLNFCYGGPSAISWIEN